MVKKRERAKKGKRRERLKRVKNGKKILYYILYREIGMIV